MTFWDNNKFLPGIDLKADGGYVVGEGSTIDGSEYRCVNSAPLRAFLLDQVCVKRKKVEDIILPKIIHDPKAIASIEAARAVPLEQVVGKAGFIKCPYHDDARPSLWVKGFGYCFPCQRRVDSIDYIRKTMGLGFMDAVKYLCGK